MDFELVELSTGNLVEAYPTQEEALRDVMACVKAYGDDAVSTLALGRRVGGEIELVASGHNLKLLASRAISAYA